MTRRANGQSDDAVTTQFESVGKTDAFLDALARGEDPSGGKDPLAALFLELRDEVERPMPDAPQLSQAPELASIGGGVSHPKRMNPWAAGLLGAAAASALLVGTGMALFHATPDSPLWGPSTAVFKDRAAAIELASTLEEIEVASQEGDADYLAQLVNQARALVDSMVPAGSSADGRDNGLPREGNPADASRTITVTVTVTPTEAAPQPPVSTQPATPSSAAPSSPQAPASSQQPQPSQPQPTGQPGPTNPEAPSSPPQSQNPGEQSSQTGPLHPSVQPEVEPHTQGQSSQPGQTQAQTVQPVHRSDAPAPQVVPASPGQP